MEVRLFSALCLQLLLLSEVAVGTVEISVYSVLDLILMLFFRLLLVLLKSASFQLLMRRLASIQFAVIAFLSLLLLWFI